MTEQEQIDDYRRVEAFLADPAVKRAFKAVDERITAEFKAAQSSTQMEMAWAKSKALDALAGELMSVMVNGQMALKQREQKQEAENRRTAGRRR